MSRRALLGGVAGVAATYAARDACAAEPIVRAPVVYLSHAAPIFAINDPARIAELTAWGSKLPRPTGILAITPHYASRRLEVGATGRGVAMYDLPEQFARRIPRGLDYPTPPSEALAQRVEALLAARAATARGERNGFDHTTWMPLKCLFPQADVPVLELAYPYVSESEALAIGRELSPLRDEGVLVFASGGMTHNLASFDGVANGAPPPRWSVEFDAWASETLAAGEVDALVDWRHKAPAWNLAHPDDGAHFRVMLLALGAALGTGASPRVTFPVTGFEGTMSKRSVEFSIDAPDVTPRQDG
jgi:4,5-DOPA dioxygenase extradiol